MDRSYNACGNRNNYLILSVCYSTRRIAFTNDIRKYPLNTFHRERPLDRRMIASIEEFLPLFCKSKESMDCYLIGKTKVVIVVTSLSHLCITREMEQLVSKNFKTIKDFKDHFLEL